MSGNNRGIGVEGDRQAPTDATQRKRAKGSEIEIPLRDRESWSVHEFAALHGLSAATVYRRAKEGSIRLSRFGGRTLVTRQAADAWLARMAAGDTQAAA
jgi:excisionase family DNA binding protein